MSASAATASIEPAASSRRAQGRHNAYTGLNCGTTYTLAVDATDAAGNRSAKASISASTSACILLPADTTPPSAPDGLQQTGAAATTITMAWSPSTDNVGVSGYNVYLNNFKVGFHRRHDLHIQCTRLRNDIRR